MTRGTPGAINGCVPLDWSQLNTLLLVGAIGYLWKQARTVDQVRQALLGIDGKGGALEEIKLLRQRSHDLANAMMALNATVANMTEFLKRIPPT